MKDKKTFSLTFAFRNANGRLYTRPHAGRVSRFRNSSAGWRWKKRVERMMNGQTNKKTRRWRRRAEQHGDRSGAPLLL